MIIDRKADKECLLIILAGYKKALWDKVVARLIKYMDIDADVCIVSSGKTESYLIETANEYGWSYMSTDINNLCFAQNECIAYFDKAKYIFKIDEDIFITEHTFSRMLSALLKEREQGPYYPGAIAPLINVNTVTFYDIVLRTGRYNDFVREFGQPFISNGRHHHNTLVMNPFAARFMWDIYDIDDKRILCNITVPCSTRFNIGCILFTRELFDAMKGFPVTLDAEAQHDRIGLGVDEKHLCTYAMLRAMPLMITHSALVGHLSYGPQEEEMMKYFAEHPGKF